MGLVAPPNQLYLERKQETATHSRYRKSNPDIPCTSSVLPSRLRANLLLARLSYLVTLFFLGPIFTIFGTHVALGEPVSTVEGIAAMVSFVGVALVAKAGASSSDTLPRSGAELLAPRPLGILLALSAAMLSAAAYTIVRKMNSGVHFMFSVFSLGLTSTVIASLAIRVSILGFLSDLAGGKVTGALLILQGIAAFAGQCALNKGLQHCRGVGVLIRNIDVPLAYFFGIAVLGEVPSIASCIGATLVFGSVVGLTVRQSLRS
jgi:drug/metabolite transporter (DMT)-like permease